MPMISRLFPIFSSIPIVSSGIYFSFSSLQQRPWNGVLPYLNYEVIADSDKTFWGYSDLTTVINAIYARTGKASVLYQIRNLIYNHGEQQIMDLRNSLISGNDDLFRIDDWLFS